MKTILTLCTLAICGTLTLRAADEKKPETKPAPPAAGEKGKHDPEEAFKNLDTNKDGFLSKEEFLAGPRAKKDPAKAEEHFKAMDKNGDGKVSLEEFKAAPHKKPGKGNK